MSNIQAEFETLTKVKRRASESFTKYAERILEQVDKLTDDDWNSLSEDAQLWATAAIDAVNDAASKGLSVSIEPFPDLNGSAGPDVGSDTDGEKAADGDTGDAAPAPSNVKVRGPERNAGKASNKKGDVTKKVGVIWRIKEIVAKNPDITHAMLLEQLAVEGYKSAESTVLGILSDFKQTIRVLKSLEMWKGD